MTPPATDPREALERVTAVPAADLRKAILAAMPVNIPLRGRISRNIMAQVVAPAIAERDATIAALTDRVGVLTADKAALIHEAQSKAFLCELAQGTLARVRERWIRAAELALKGDPRALARVLDTEKNPKQIVGSSTALHQETQDVGP